MNRGWRKISFALSLLFFVVTGIQSPGQQIPAKLLSELGSPEFRDRETAQAELLLWSRERPEGAMTALLGQFRQASDPEIRERCLQTLKELVNDEYLKDGEGFIGISMLDETAQIRKEAKLRHVIRVSQIVKGSAAEQSGLKLNDLIIGLNGEIWTEKQAAESFSAKIKNRKPGTKVILQISRNLKLIEIEVILGKRPLNVNFMLMGDFGLDVNAAENEAREAYFRQWLRNRKE